MTYRRTEHLQVLFDKHFSLLNVSERAVMTGWLTHNGTMMGVALAMKTSEYQVTAWRALR